MLIGVDPLLTGEILRWLDGMGHSDTVIVADANFPAARLGRTVVELPAATTPAVLRALLTVLPLDEGRPAFLMREAVGRPVPVQDELRAVLPTEPDLLDRQSFYRAAAECCCLIRTGDVRAYGNVGLYKGVLPEGTRS